MMIFSTALLTLRYHRIFYLDIILSLFYSPFHLKTISHCEKEFYFNRRLRPYKSKKHRICSSVIPFSCWPKNRSVLIILKSVHTGDTVFTSVFFKVLILVSSSAICNCLEKFCLAKTLLK